MRQSQSAAGEAKRSVGLVSLLQIQAASAQASLYQEYFLTPKQPLLLRQGEDLCLIRLIGNSSVANDYRRAAFQLIRSPLGHKKAVAQPKLPTATFNTSNQQSL
jgi:hypothetical protein